MKHINSQTAKMLFPSVDFSTGAADKVINAHGGADTVNIMLKVWHGARNVGIDYCLPAVEDIGSTSPLYKWIKSVISCFDGSLQSKNNIVSAIELFGATIGAQAGIPFKMESRVS